MSSSARPKRSPLCRWFLILTIAAVAAPCLLPTRAGARPPAYLSPTHVAVARSAAAPSFPGMRNFKVSFVARRVHGHRRQLKMLKVLVLHVQPGDTVSVSCVLCEGSWRGPSPYLQQARSTRFVLRTPGLVVTNRSLLDVSVDTDGSGHQRRYALKPVSGTLELKMEWCYGADHNAILPCHGFQGPDLWATVSSCTGLPQPLTVGLRAVTPALGDDQTTAFVRYRLYRVQDDGALVRVGLSPFHALGPANTPHEDGQVFTLPAGSSGIYRGEADFQWDRDGRVVYTATLLTTQGDVSQAGSDSPAASMESCPL